MPFTKALRGAPAWLKSLVAAPPQVRASGQSGSHTLVRVGLVTIHGVMRLQSDRGQVVTLIRQEPEGHNYWHNQLGQRGSQGGLPCRGL